MNSLAAMRTLPRASGVRHSCTLAVTLSLFASQVAWAQDDVVTRLLLSTAWCQESFTEISRHTARLTFFPDGTLRFRKEMDLSNGSHNATNHTARWLVRSDTLVIAEPNGGESRLPIVVQGTGQNTRLTLGNATYSICR